jgi:hypothetical protein
VGIEVIAAIVGGAVIVLLTIHFTSVHYAKKSAVEEFRRNLEEYARKTSEEVTDVLGSPLGTDDELLAKLKPAGMPETGDDR